MSELSGNEIRFLRSQYSPPFRSDDGEGRLVHSLLEDIDIKRKRIAELEKECDQAVRDRVTLSTGASKYRRRIAELETAVRTIYALAGRHAVVEKCERVLRIRKKVQGE